MGFGYKFRGVRFAVGQEVRIWYLTEITEKYLVALVIVTDTGFVTSLFRDKVSPGSCTVREQKVNFCSVSVKTVKLTSKPKDFSKLQIILFFASAVYSQGSNRLSDWNTESLSLLSLILPQSV